MVGSGLGVEDAEGGEGGRPEERAQRHAQYQQLDGAPRRVLVALEHAPQLHVLIHCHRRDQHVTQRQEVAGHGEVREEQRHLERLDPSSI
ncbi:hypothetical protein ON010_g3683 [Phytophthora cinnamomi]|nr:hypothetical protein ON010_g3683 [Phytophthora cinnamomi]